MCGIVGFTGHHNATPILLEGLSKLEYLGYAQGFNGNRHKQGALRRTKGI